MQNFIVLGIVPGTSVQITFLFWLYVAMGIACLPILAILYRHRFVVKAYFAARKIRRFINQYQLSA